MQFAPGLHGSNAALCSLPRGIVCGAPLRAKARSQNPLIQFPRNRCSREGRGARAAQCTNSTALGTSRRTELPRAHPANMESLARWAGDTFCGPLSPARSCDRVFSDVGRSQRVVSARRSGACPARWLRAFLCSAHVRRGRCGNNLQLPPIAAHFRVLGGQSRGCLRIFSDRRDLTADSEIRITVPAIE